MNYRSFLQIAWFGSCALIAGTATADESSARACTTIADKMARLSCYDAAFGVNPVQAAHAATPAAQPVAPLAASPAVAAPAVAASVAPAATAPAAPPAMVPAKTPLQQFGDTGSLRGSPKTDLPKKVTATVVSASPVGQGMYQLKLDNGQLWQTTQANWVMDFRPSTSVTISRMMMGNYLIALTGQGQTVSVKRIE